MDRNERSYPYDRSVDCPPPMSGWNGAFGIGAGSLPLAAPHEQPNQRQASNRSSDDANQLASGEAVFRRSFLCPNRWNWMDQYWRRKKS